MTKPKEDELPGPDPDTQSASFTPEGAELPEPITPSELTIVAAQTAEGGPGAVGYVSDLDGSWRPL